MIVSEIIGHKKITGIQTVFVHVQIGKYHLLYDYRLYNPNIQVSKHDLAKEMIVELKALLKNFKNITVLTDSWYAEVSLMKYVTENCKWDWISAIKSNRTIDDEQVKSKFW